MAVKDEQESGLLVLACAKIADAQKLMGEARELLKKDLENKRQEEITFEELTKTFNRVYGSDTVKLNVGGKMYETKLDTLRKDPHNMLGVMFSGRHKLKAVEKDGAYFIDRDGKLFG